MAQDYTTDCYDPAHVADTDLDNIEDNFAALKSSFSGASAPSNPVAGQWWLDTTNHIFKLRNEDNDDWIDIFDLSLESRASDRHLRFTLTDPYSLHNIDTQICLIPSLDAAITISNLEVTCDSDPATEIAGDLKYADDFISLSNATVINDFDTTAGVRSDSSITNGSVASGKCIYIEFDSQPIADILQICFDITYNYN